MTTTEQQSIVFHTHTLMDPISWEMMGISAKTSDSAIGVFGTGLKYAVAVLLRTGHEFVIHTNNQTYEFGLADMTFRDKEFKQITCNGKGLPFTTEYGKFWEVWQAYRELVSNTIDEGGIHFAGTQMPEGTSIVVTGPDISKCLQNHEDYFLGDREPLELTRSLGVYKGNGTLFYKGIRVGELPNALHSYELFTAQLTEDRTIKDMYTVASSIMMHLCKLTDPKLIKRIITASKGEWEFDQDYDWTWSDEFLNVVREVWQSDATAINPKIQTIMKRRYPNTEFVHFEPTPYQSEMVVKAKDILSRIGYPITAEIEFVKNDNPVLLGYVYNKLIHVTPKAFTKGMFDLVVTLFEEQHHILGHEDFTRGFQTYLIESVIDHAKNRFEIKI